MWSLIQAALSGGGGGVLRFQGAPPPAADSDSANIELSLSAQPSLEMGCRSPQTSQLRWRTKNLALRQGPPGPPTGDGACLSPRSACVAGVPATAESSSPAAPPAPEPNLPPRERSVAAAEKAAANPAAAAVGATWQLWYDPEEGREEEEDERESREERCYRAWVASLRIPPRGGVAGGGAGAGAAAAAGGGGLFGPGVRSGWLLLELVDHLQPGCVDFSAANRPPFRRAAGGLPRALENCERALGAAREALGLQLVNITPIDIVQGRRKPILSLFYQLMRYHVLQMLEGLDLAHTCESGPVSREPSFGGCDPRLAAEVIAEAAAEGTDDAAAVAAAALPGLLPVAAADEAAAGGLEAGEDLAAPSTPEHTVGRATTLMAPAGSDDGAASDDGRTESDASGAAAGTTTPSAAGRAGGSRLRHSTGGAADPLCPPPLPPPPVASPLAAAGRIRRSSGGGASGGAGGGGASPRTPRGGRPSSDGLVFGSSSRKQRRRLLQITEADIAAWANLRIAATAEAWGPGAAAPAAHFSSFRDPSLGSGVAVLQVLSAIAPGSVDPAFVSPGGTPREREANARYALAAASRVGVSTFMLHGDIEDPQPRLLLVLFASLMAFDAQRRREELKGQQQQQGVQDPLSYNTRL